MITINAFSYTPSTPSYMVQGVKNHYIPRNAVGGSNGSIIMPGDPPQILLGFIEDGVGHFTNIYSLVKSHSSRKITRKYASEICMPLINQDFENWEAVRISILSRIS